MPAALPASPPHPTRPPVRRPAPIPPAPGPLARQRPAAGPSDTTPADATPAAGTAPIPLPATGTSGRRQLTRLVVLLTEALAGRRPHAQLAPVLTYPVQTALRVLPRQPHDLRVRSVHLCQVDRRTVEIAATVSAGRRAKAIAARAEHTEAGWRLTALHLVGR